MKLSNMLFKTYRDNPADSELKSHSLLVRAGYIKKVSAGSYMYLPFAMSVMEKIKQVVREEMEKIDCQELLMPILLPQELYGPRLSKFGSEMFRLKDRTNRDMCLGPTHEEAFTSLVKDLVTSYKQLPVSLYQINTKFRDEVRPRYGLQRAKEFVMKDAYSFHVDTNDLDEYYEKMKGAYLNVFKRLGLDVVPVEADTGAMGGNGSHEFMVINDVGEDEIAYCPHCRYAANVERAVKHFELITNKPKSAKKIIYNTPNTKTIADVCDFVNYAGGFNFTAKDFVKCVAYKSEGGILFAFVRGDREVEETKLKNHFNVNNLEMASVEDIEKFNTVSGYIGPFDLETPLVVLDNDIQNMSNFVCGGNKKDEHIINFNVEDINLTPLKSKSLYADISKVKDGDICSVCGMELKTCRGIEIGHIFKLGQKYTKVMDCKYLDNQGKSQYIEMGCYGIGISRTLSAIVEQFGDEKGIVLPEIVAPYKVIVMVANSKDEVQQQKGEELYNALLANGITAILDDRKESFGVKLNDAELIGMPYIYVVGREANENRGELITRKTLEKEVKTFDEIIQILK